MAAAAAAGGGDASKKRKKQTYKGSEEEFDFNCDVLDKLYQEVELERRGPNGSNSFSSFSSSANPASAASAAAAAAAAGIPPKKDEKAAGAPAAGAADRKDSKAEAKAKAPIPGEGSRFLAAIRRVPNESKLILSCSDGDNVWTTLLAYKEFCDHRQLLDIGDGVGWKDLFGYLKSAFDHRGKLNIELSNWSAPTINVLYSLQDGIDLVGKFTLKQITDLKLKTKETSTIMFSLLERAKVNLLAQQTADELRKAKNEMQTLHQRISGLQSDLVLAHAEKDRLAAQAVSMSQMHDFGAAGDPGAAAAAAAAAAFDDKSMPPPAAIVVKNKNMSVANPRQKRRAKRGVKIGEAD